TCDPALNPGAPGPELTWQTSMAQPDAFIPDANLVVSVRSQGHDSLRFRLHRFEPARRRIEKRLQQLLRPASRRLPRAPTRGPRESDPGKSHLWQVSSAAARRPPPPQTPPLQIPARSSAPPLPDAV